MEQVVSGIGIFSTLKGSTINEPLEVPLVLIFILFAIGTNLIWNIFSGSLPRININILLNLLIVRLSLQECSNLKRS
jgi:hypothetical protein